MNILLVEDNLTTQEALGEILKRQGCQVTFCKNAHDAQAAMLDGTPDVVISDYMMDQVSGLELLEYMRSVPEYHKIPFVMISAVPEMDDIGSAVEANQPAILLRKPFQTDEFLAAVVKVTSPEPL